MCRSSRSNGCHCVTAAVIDVARVFCDRTKVWRGVFVCFDMRSLSVAATNRVSSGRLEPIDPEGIESRPEALRCKTSLVMKGTRR